MGGLNERRTIMRLGRATKTERPLQHGKHALCSRQGHSDMERHKDEPRVLIPQEQGSRIPTTRLRGRPDPESYQGPECKVLRHTSCLLYEDYGIQQYRRSRNPGIHCRSIAHTTSRSLRRRLGQHCADYRASRRMLLSSVHEANSRTLFDHPDISRREMDDVPGSARVMISFYMKPHCMDFPPSLRIWVFS
ncbi:hypothetical protein BDW22DRAFT_343088 [Trametopsis cervina]|nr:hypothetical protein BDW22DRAFT_343088 [Trametopsis cervina]